MTEPWKHGQGCLLKSVCKPDGWGLMCKDPNNAGKYIKTYTFGKQNTVASQQAETYIKSQSSNFCVTLTGATKSGSADSNGVTTLSNLGTITESDECRMESVEPSATTTSNLGRENLLFMYTLEENVAEVHYGLSGVDNDTANFCVRNLEGSAWVGFGP